MSIRRTALTLFAVAASGTMLALGVASPAQAGPPAPVGVVTVSYDPGTRTYSVTPQSVDGKVGDTFTLANTLTSGNSNPSYYVSLKNMTGQVSLGGTSCVTDADCPVLDLFAGTASGTFTIDTLGTIDVMRVYNGAAAVQIGTITLGAMPPAPAAPPVTATFDPNGGTCTGTLSFTKANGENGTVTTPTAYVCERPNYSLLGWARSADAHSAAFAPGMTIPIGDESFTLFAVWSANGVAVTYNANVAMKDQCSANGANLATEAQRRTTMVVTSSTTGQAVTLDSSGYVRWSTSVPAAPCTPPGYVLAGWSTSPSGSPLNTAENGNIVTTGDGLSPNGKAGPGADRVTLYAKWVVTYGITLTPTKSTVTSGDFSTLTVKATRNGAAAANEVVSLSIAPSGLLRFSNSGQATSVTTNAQGEATVTVVADPDAEAKDFVVTASYGDKSASATVSVQDPVRRSIVIVGERTTVSGKSGIRVDGATEGFAEGDIVNPYVKLAGQTEYTKGVDKTIDMAGEFAWQRKTGKKAYVYFKSADGSVKSNTVIIPTA